MDYPDGRKMHSDPKPLVGGIGMMIGFFISALFFIPLSNLRGFYAGIVILGIVGFLDDFRELSHRWKFIVQILASLLMIYFSDTILLSFGDIFSFGAITLNYLAIPVTVFCTIGVINAMNMIDGLDGLAGGVSLVAFISFAILSYINNQPALVLLCIALSGSIVSFLRYNWYPSSLFMGDAGSLFLGFSLAFLSIAITQSGGGYISPVVPLLILAVPIVDTITIMIRRILKGKNPFHADKYHFHHILIRFGLNDKDAVKVILLLSVGLSVIAITGTILRVPDYNMFLVFLVYSIFFFSASFCIKKMFRYQKRFRYNANISKK